MRITRANLAVAVVASKDKKLPALNRVHLSPDGSTVASNGSALLAVGPPDPEKVAGFPDDHDEPPIPEDGVGVSLEAIAAVKRNLPTDKRIALQQVKVTRCDTKVEFLTSDGTAERTFAKAKMRGTFPQWRRIIADSRRRTTKTTVCVNRRELMGMLKAIDEACPDRGEFAPVLLEIGEPGDPVVLRSRNYETEQRVVGQISPLVLKDGWHATTEWERELFAEGEGGPRPKATPKRRGPRIVRPG